MKEMVQYIVGDVEKEVENNFSGWRLVLVAHDEMTAQANDGQKKEWVLDGDYRLQKKGAGQGLH